MVGLNLFVESKSNDLLWVIFPEFLGQGGRFLLQRVIAAVLSLELFLVAGKIGLVGSKGCLLRFYSFSHVGFKGCQIKTEIGRFGLREILLSIGQDNLYFYGVAQPALWEALRPGGLFAEGPDSQMRQTTLVANHHMLFGKKKASSSGAVKPPTGEELLEHYTPEQLRAHFLALGLDQKSVGFSPKPFDPDPAKRDDPRYADPVLKEGALLTNVFNRLARSCFYEAQKNFDGCMPLGAVTPEVRRRAFEALLDYEERMHKVELHRVMSVCDEFIRWSNKWWADGIKAAEASEDADARRQVLVDSFYLLRVACLLMHPVVPVGCEKICDYLSFDFGDFFSWNYDFDSNDELCPAIEIDAGAHRIHELPPRFDFFRKHESQYK